MTSKVGVYIISKSRPKNVPNMQELTQMPIIWVIPEYQREQYAEQGAQTFLHADGLMAQRNLALEHAADNGLYCVQSDDDLKKMQRLKYGKAKEYTFHEAISDMIEAMEQTDARLAGTSPTSNPFYASEEIKPAHFILASLMAQHPEAGLRFDTEIPLKEDYDLTLQHLAKFGKVARCDWLIPEYQHYTNDGGVKEFRTDELESRAVDILMEKWGDVVRPHPRRENEVVIRWDAERYHAYKRKNRVWQ